MSGPASEIRSYLFVGGSSGAKDETDLAERGITHVGEPRAVAQQLPLIPSSLATKHFAVPDSAWDRDRKYGVLD